MAFSWLTLMWVYVANSAWLGLIFLAQCLDKRIPPRGSIIPGTNQVFIYMQDWHNLLWGDTIALPLVIYAFVQTMKNGFVGARQWIFFVITSNVITVVFFQFAILSPTHRPNYSMYDIGKVSWPGLMHMPYFGICVTIAILAFWNAVNGKIRSRVLLCGLIGGVLYTASCLIDATQGHYAPLQLIGQ